MVSTAYDFNTKLYNWPDFNYSTRIVTEYNDKNKQHFKTEMSNNYYNHLK